MMYTFLNTLRKEKRDKMPGGGVPPLHTGKHWYTDGAFNRLGFECPEGFHPGKTQKSGKDHAFYGVAKTYEIKGTFAKGSTPWNKP